MLRFLLTLGVHVFSQFQGVRVGQVSVGRSDGQDQAALSADELHDHVPDLLLDVDGLVPHRHLSDPRQVDESQIQDCRIRGRRRCMRRAHFENVLTSNLEEPSYVSFTHRQGTFCSSLNI